MFGVGDRSALGQENRVGPGSSGAATRYKVHEALVHLADEFWIDDEQGEHVYKVNGKLLTPFNTLDMVDMQGNVLVKLRGSVLAIGGEIKLERAGQPDIAVKKSLISFMRDHLTMSAEGGGAWDIKGDLLNHEYVFSSGNEQVAVVSRQWFRLSDTYGVEIAAGADDALILAATIAVDLLCRDSR